LASHTVPSACGYITGSAEYTQATTNFYCAPREIMPEQLLAHLEEQFVIFGSVQIRYPHRRAIAPPTGTFKC
jgi:hypothetical protein